MTAKAAATTAAATEIEPWTEAAELVLVSVTTAVELFLAEEMEETAEPVRVGTRVSVVVAVPVGVMVPVAVVWWGLKPMGKLWE